MRIGDWVLDAGAGAAAGKESGAVWLAPSLNPFLGRAARRGRPRATGSPRSYRRGPPRRASSPTCVPLDDVTMHLPIEVADYVDFYASEHHATNVGRIFRPDSEPLTPNWKHLPIGYHGRAGTVVVSGTDVVRPSGQRKAPTEPAPSSGRAARLDIEAELGFVVGGGTALGEPVTSRTPTSTSSASSCSTTGAPATSRRGSTSRSGPFLGKSFATSISPWVVTTEALRAARVPLPGQDPEPLPYLRGDRRRRRGHGLRARPARRGRLERHGRLAPASSATCTGRRRRCWRT